MSARMIPTPRAVPKPHFVTNCHDELLSAVAIGLERMGSEVGWTVEWGIWRMDHQPYFYCYRSRNDICVRFERNNETLSLRVFGDPDRAKKRRGIGLLLADPRLFDKIGDFVRAAFDDQCIG